MRLFPIWAGVHQNLQSMLAEFFWCFSSTPLLFVPPRAVACSALLIGINVSPSFFLNHEFAIAERRLFLARNLSRRITTRS